MFCSNVEFTDLFLWHKIFLNSSNFALSFKSCSNELKGAEDYEKQT